MFTAILLVALAMMTAALWSLGSRVYRLEQDSVADLARIDLDALAEEFRTARVKLRCESEAATVRSTHLGSVASDHATRIASLEKANAQIPHQVTETVQNLLYKAAVVAKD